MGDRVAWGGRTGSFVRNLNDGIHAENQGIEQRAYRVRIGDCIQCAGRLSVLTEDRYPARPFWSIWPCFG